MAGMAIATGVTAGLPAPAHAQSSDVTLNVEAGPLAGALNNFASETGYQLLYPSDLTSGKTSPGARGAMSVSEGLSRILSGTGLSFQLLNGKTIQLVADVAADGERVTGAVKVEGGQSSPYFGGAGKMAGVNGVNGSRDITATEGTKSFTSGALTIGSKVAQSIKDVPQSLSVLTAERFEQQNITDFTTAMRQLAGVTLVQGTDSLEQTFYSRGFAINSIQLDGGAPIQTNTANYDRAGFVPQLDLSVYDHIELLRGAAGTFNGYGDPGGTVNLVRKKPLDHQQFVVEAQAGSADLRRIVLDAASPLALDGRLRGRLITTFQENKYFYRIAKDNKKILYGIAEFDATPTTLVTGGINYSRQNSTPWDNGLPRYANGDDLGLPRSTCLCFPWNHWDFRTTELFGSIEQKVGDDWTAKLNVTRVRQNSKKKVGDSSGAVYVGGDGSGPVTDGTREDYISRQLSAEFTVNGAFKIFGQRQEVSMGVSRARTDSGGQLGYDPIMQSVDTPYIPYPGGPEYSYSSPLGPAPAINVFTFDPYDRLYSEPADMPPKYRYTQNLQQQTGAFINVRLTAFNRLHLTSGIRWTWYETKTAFESLCTSPTSPFCFGGKVGDVVSANSQNGVYKDKDVSWPPSVSVSYDLTDRLTGYVGYTSIYENQGNYVGFSGKPIPPVSGENIEAGAKWQARDGRLNVSVSAYRIRKKGFPLQAGEIDYNVTDDEAARGISYYVVGPDGQRIANGQTDPNHQCCYVPDPANSQSSEGFDLEAAGEVRRGWQVAANYTYNKNENRGINTGPAKGISFITLQPKHLYKLWTSFDFGAAGEKGWLSGFTLSAGVNGQSSGYQQGAVCQNFGPPDALGFRPCKSYSPPDFIPYAFTVPSYAVFSGRVDYSFSKAISLAVNLENILDKRYYRASGSSTGGNWYGSPRAVTVTLRGTW